jgi:hypothetical protein
MAGNLLEDLERDVEFGEADALALRSLHQPAELAAARRALAKILDLELAVMLHTCREDLLAREARAKRLATFGHLVGSIARDLRNPLGVVERSLFILGGRLPDGERARKHAERQAPSP